MRHRKTELQYLDFTLLTAHLNTLIIHFQNNDLDPAIFFCKEDLWASYLVEGRQRIQPIFLGITDTLLLYSLNA